VPECLHRSKRAARNRWQSPEDDTGEGAAHERRDDRQGRRGGFDRSHLANEKREERADASPAIAPSDVSVAASTRNCQRIVPRVAPSALRTPISRVRS